MNLLILLTLSAMAGDVSQERILSTEGKNWFLKGGDFTGQHYSPLASINADTVHQLGLAWSVDLPIPDGVSTTPIVVDGVIYLSGAYSVVLAIDAESGDVLWQFDPNVREAFVAGAMLSWPARVNRGVAVWQGRVYLTTADCRLIALDAGTGTQVWQKQTCDNEKGYFITDSPYVGGGKIFLGNAGSEAEEGARGYVSAFDAESGELLWRFYIVPSADPEENNTEALKMAAKTWSGDTLAKHGGGGHSWNEMTYDPASNQLFFGTSGAYPYLHHKRAPLGGDNLFLSSIVAVDADTGKYRWHYQTVDKDSWDYNATMNIVLADMELRGDRRETLLIAPKNGFHYTLDRHDGELLAAGKFARTNWASDIDIETGKPIYDPAGEYWNLEEGEQGYLWPNMWGAHNWHPMAYHPGTNLSYIPVVDAPALVSGGEESEAIVMLTEVDGAPHSPGKLVAMDPSNGRIAWQIEHALPFNGGLMTTGGNLLFQGLATGEFQAYAADDGDVLWSVQTGSAINASPATYAIDKTQYVVIPIGSGGGLQFQYPLMHGAEVARGPTRLLAFALERDAKMPMTSIEARPLPDHPDPDASDAVLALGRSVYGSACKICHGSKGVARLGGTVPDLRYVTQETLALWDAIVVGGAKASGGMPAVGVTAEQSQAVRAYIINQAQSLR